MKDPGLLASRLLKSWMLWAALRWYDKHLVPGQSVDLPKPSRERGQKLKRYFKYYLKASRLLLGIVYRRGKGWYLGDTAWRTLQAKLPIAVLGVETESAFKQLPPDFLCRTWGPFADDVGEEFIELVREYIRQGPKPRKKKNRKQGYKPTSVDISLRDFCLTYFPIGPEGAII
jgi:hypothetical protein